MFTHLSPRARRGTLCAFVTSLALAAATAPQPGIIEAAGCNCAYRVRIGPGGTTSADGSVAIFQGILDAAPPVGQLRWAAPQPPAAWSGVRDALRTRSPCPQTGQYASLNEDCLYLNVWAPVRYANKKLPVMVWVHPGCETSSAANDYNPQRLITHGTPAIFVSFNFRLNIFAFFAHKALTAELPQLGSGNYAGLDQQQVLKVGSRQYCELRWRPRECYDLRTIRRSARVCGVLASPPAKGLFHKAISREWLVSVGALSLAYRVREQRSGNCHGAWLRGLEPAALSTGSADKCHFSEASERRRSISRSARLG